MSLLLKEYLVSHTIRELEDEHGVCMRPSADFTKFSVNYDQILVKNGDPLAEQCRGLIMRPSREVTEMMLIDEEKRGNEPISSALWRDRIFGEAEVLAWPMNRFYNHGDSAGAEINWSDPDLRVYEKLDGTMIILYWDPLHVKWCTSTRSVPEADLPIKLDHMEIGNTTFSELFLQALHTTIADSVDSTVCFVGGTLINEFFNLCLNKEMTYVFELTTPYNRIVVKYDRAKVTLLAARHTQTGKEVAIETLQQFKNINRPKTWNLRSALSVAAFVDNINPAELEGAVICDSQFRRLKFKNKAWILASRSKDLVTVSRRSALNAILQGKIDDVLPLVEKDVAEKLERMREDTKIYFKQVDSNFNEWKEKANGSKKEFASLVMNSGDWTPIYFNLWDGRSNSALSWAVDKAESGKLTDSSLDSILAKIGHLKPD